MVGIIDRVGVMVGVTVLVGVIVGVIAGVLVKVGVTVLVGVGVTQGLDDVHDKQSLNVPLKEFQINVIVPTFIAITM